MKTHIKSRYSFAMSSFARLYGVRHVNSCDQIHRFCMEWAEGGETPPLTKLTKVDFYFRDIWTGKLQN